MNENTVCSWPNHCWVSYISVEKLTLFTSTNPKSRLPQMPHTEAVTVVLLLLFQDDVYNLGHRDVIFGFDTDVRGLKSLEDLNALRFVVKAQLLELC